MIAHHKSLRLLLVSLPLSIYLVTMSTDETKQNVVVSPLALTSMLLHSAKHGTTSVHGILIGTFSPDAVKVTSAIPVCHEAPTKPLIDTALSLVEGGVVGWYTAPERLEDERPGAPALRIVASLAASNTLGEPVLIVLQNQAVVDCLTGKDATSDASVIKAFGKDFGQQWMEPLNVSLQSETKALEAARQAHAEKVVLNDLVDHWEGDSASTEWYPSAAVAKCVEHVL